MLLNRPLYLTILSCCSLVVVAMSGCASTHSSLATTAAQPALSPASYETYLANRDATQNSANQATQEVVRAQSYDTGSGSRQAPVAQQIPASGQAVGGAQQATYQYPEIGNTGAIYGATPSGVGQFQNRVQIGDPNQLNPLVAPNFAPGGVAAIPQNFADIDVILSEAQTGRVNIGGAFNSDNGVVGQFTIDEKNFDITRFPRSFREIADGTAFRGGGQQFRLELVPGNNVERYLVSLTEPFLFDTKWSLSLSAYLFQRQFFDWDEQRVGGRAALGYRLSPDLSLSIGLRAENVQIDDPRVATSAQLNDALGDTDLYLGTVSLISDTRDHPFLPSEGRYLGLTYSQGFGQVDFPRLEIDYRRYFKLYERPDTSGRHTLSVGTKVGFSGSDTPVFENFFAGGFSTIRGFDFRGASPVEGGVIVGGEFQWLSSVEYQFPITADDMVKGVLFCDFGTVEESVELSSDTFRVAPGFGFRVNMPAAGLGAPLAFDFAFPVAHADTDDTEVFSFYLGVGR